METTIRCDEVKIISEGEKVKLIIIGVDEDDIQETFRNFEIEKYAEMYDYPIIHNGEF